MYAFMKCKKNNKLSVSYFFKFSQDIMLFLKHAPIATVTKQNETNGIQLRHHDEWN